MEQETAISILSRFNKWIKSKGKKYVICDICLEDVCSALSYATNHLKRRVGKDEFITLVNMAFEDAGYRKRDNEVLTDLHKSALKNGRKVVKFLTKNNG